LTVAQLRRQHEKDQMDSFLAYREAAYKREAFRKAARKTGRTEGDLRQEVELLEKDGENAYKAFLSWLGEDHFALLAEAEAAALQEFPDIKAGPDGFVVKNAPKQDEKEEPEEEATEEPVEAPPSPQGPVKGLLGSFDNGEQIDVQKQRAPFA